MVVQGRLRVKNECVSFQGKLLVKKANMESKRTSYAMSS